MTVRSPNHRLFSLRARRQDGFTLIELLVVIVILGVLAAIVVFSVRGIGDKGRKNAIAADAATLRTAEEAYCAKYGKYGTVDDLIDKGLLASQPVYNAVGLDIGGGKCGSFTVNDTSTPTSFDTDITVGTAPSDLAVNEKAGLLYVANTGSNNVTVINGDTNAPSTIDVSGAGVTSPTRVAVNADTGQVYVGGTAAVAGGNSIARIDGNTVTPVTGFTAPVSALAVSPENGDLYVAGGTFDTSAVAYITAQAPGSAQAIQPPAGLANWDLVGANLGVDFAFDAVHHAVYVAKSSAGLSTIASQTHVASVVKQFNTVSACSNTNPPAVEGDIPAASVRGSVAVDPNRNLVYLLATTCVRNPASDTLKAVATRIVINRNDNTQTMINDFATQSRTPIAAVYNPAAGSVYVYVNGGTGSSKIERIVGTAVTGQAPVGPPSSGGNYAHKITTLTSFNRVFALQSPVSGGGVGVADGGTLLTQAALGTPRVFVAVATDNTKAKVYAVDSAGGKVAVFTTGSA